MGYLELSRSYTPQSTGVRIDEFNESAVTATITEIELRVQLVEQARQAHCAWFACCLELAGALGYPRFPLPYRPYASVLSGEVPWRLFLDSRSVAELKHDLASALKEEPAFHGLPDD
jgi:hypothetical protein